MRWKSVKIKGDHLKKGTTDNLMEGREGAGISHREVCFFFFVLKNNYFMCTHVFMDQLKVKKNTLMSRVFYLCPAHDGLGWVHFCPVVALTQVGPENQSLV